MILNKQMVSLKRTLFEVSHRLMLLFICYYIVNFFCFLILTSWKKKGGLKGGLPCPLLPSPGPPLGFSSCLIRFTIGPPLRTRSKHTHTHTECGRLFIIFQKSEINVILCMEQTRNALINTSGVFSWRPTHYRLGWPTV